MKEGDAFLLGVLAGVLGVLVVAPYMTLFLLRHSRIVRDATRYRLENAVDQKIGKAVAEARRGQRPLARAAVNLAVPIIETASGQKAFRRSSTTRSARKASSQPSRRSTFPTPE